MRRLGRTVLLALLFALLLGFAIGTAIRMRLERPVEYLGSVPGSPRPLDVADVRPPVLGARDHEEQIG